MLLTAVAHRVWQCLVLLVLPLAAVGAHALEPVGDFGANPGALAMFEHVPDAPGPLPLVLALHGCTQDRGWADEIGLVALADQHGVALVVAEQGTANNQDRCFNWFVEGDIDAGEGEARSLAQMIDAMKARHDIDGARIFVMGLSAGGAMTSVMLAAYPEVFAAGVVFAGVPYRCGTGMVDAFSCMSAPPSRTQQQWADLVTGATAHRGPWPRVAVWQGESDYTVRPANADAIVLQWTGVHGLALESAREGTLEDAVRTRWGSAEGLPLVESVRIPRMGHGTPVDPESGCGRAGAFSLPVGICAGGEAFGFFGLTGPSHDDAAGGDDGASLPGLGAACCAQASTAPACGALLALALRRRRRR